MAAKSYLSAAGVVAPLVLADLFLNLSYMLEGVFYVFRRTILKLYVNLIATAATLTFYACLIPGYGMYGAAWGTALGYFVLFICTLAFSRRVYRIPLPWGRFLVTLLGGIALVTACTMFEGLSVKVVALLVGIVLFVGVIAVNRQ